MSSDAAQAGHNGCRRCGCGSGHPAWHAIAAAVADGDVDAALQAGLLDALPCPDCDDGCHAAAVAMRNERATALAARERFRARQARLARKDALRAAQRSSAARLPSALPAAAAAALARAKARAAGR